MVILLASATIMLGIFAYETRHRSYYVGTLATGFACVYCAFTSLGYFAGIIRQ